MEKRQGKEILPVALSAIGLLALSLLAYTPAQKKHIKDRDNNVCQFPDKHVCNGDCSRPVEERKLQVHHIIPQRYADRVGIENPDTEENGITLCKNSHVGSQGIHPDIATAHSHTDFDGIFKQRDELLNQHKIYWNDKWDRLLHVISLRNTQRFKTSGKIFPIKKCK